MQDMTLWSRSHMKVTGPQGPASTQGQKSTRAAGGFSLGGQAAGLSGAGAAAPAASASGLSGVSALMALQSVETATERRRRAVKRGGGLLDRLDELKLALLSGQDGGETLDRLARVLREERPDDDDAELNAVLDQIDVRASVELAKLEMARKGA